ncbi:MAG: Mbeg1-like protein [Eubacterium sp.]
MRGNVRGQIERIYSHDGPGMNEQIIAYSYYQEMAGRIRKTIPGFSVIGTLLGQQEISKVIKSDGVGILQHNPFNWVVEKGEFVPLPGLNKTAELLDQKIDNWVSGMTTEEREEFVNKLFSVISEAENLNGIGENWRDEFGRIAKKLLIP